MLALPCVYYMLAWIMDMFLLFDSIVYMLSCIIVHVLALIYLLVWWYGMAWHDTDRRYTKTHAHIDIYAGAVAKIGMKKAVWKDEKLKSKDWICAMCNVKWSKLFLPPSNVSTEQTNERSNDRVNDWVSERTKAISSICILSAVPEHCFFLTLSLVQCSCYLLVWCVCVFVLRREHNVERRCKTKRLRRIANLWDLTYWINFFAPQCHGLRL